MYALSVVVCIHGLVVFVSSNIRVILFMQAFSKDGFAVVALVWVSASGTSLKHCFRISLLSLLTKLPYFSIPR